ncbi:ABC transporter ATP-binding protein [Nonomuraea aurantiaca]|uniref:ABC transporter ATP-binding protein n=1 Tax=Nonomuraea aurantiaca TaxID=2878562 RepID=UPI001CD9E2C3|nr:ABC transporter ATP-binding protein [Nonomuraea aurantiaca]MCA2227864.1 ABC transporter ATP-binding protein [Nonomuraea aurantiaca]
MPWADYTSPPTGVSAPSRTSSVAPAVELVGLTKIYPGRKSADGDPVAAVDGVHLRVPPGKVFGLLGRNGAGKSTIIRMIATLMTPTAGRISVCGHDTRDRQREVRKLLGVALGGERSVYWKLTARQNLEYFAALHGRSRRRSRARIQQVLEELNLSDRADDHVEQYSTGMRQRLVIARALLNRPAVILLDEPTSGLDVHAAENLHEHVRELRRAGQTIILTTHDMAEADALSDRVAIIESGRLVAEGTPAELKQSIGAAQVIHARLRHPGDDVLRAFVAELSRVARITIDRDGEAVVLTLLSQYPDDLVPWIIAASSRYRTAVLRIESEPVSLKNVFLAVTGSASDDDPARR